MAIRWYARLWNFWPRGSSALPFGEGRLGDALLAPTHLYVKPCLAALRASGVHGFAHIWELA